MVQKYHFFPTPLPILTAFYRNLPILTETYCFLPHFTDSYRLGGRLPFVERQTNGKRTANSRTSANGTERAGRPTPTGRRASFGGSRVGRRAGEGVGRGGGGAGRGGDKRRVGQGDEVAVRLDMLDELGVEAVAAKSVGIAEDDELHAGAGDGDVHAAEVAEEADGALVVVAHHADDYHVALLPLEAVDTIHRNLMAERAEELLPLEQATDEAHLRTIGRDDAKVDALVLNAAEAYHLDIVAQGVDEQACLLGVGAAEGAALTLAEMALRGVEPGDGRVDGRHETVRHLGGGGEAAMVEPAGGERHDGAVHTVLHGEERDAAGLGSGHLLHECAVEAGTGGFEALDGGWQLAVVATEDDAVGLEDGSPAGGFEGLGSLVDEEGGEAAPLEDAVGGADEGAGDDAGTVEEVLLNADFQLGGAGAHTGKACLPLTAFAVGASPFAKGAADAPELGIVGMVGIAALVAAIEHLTAHAQGVADAQHGHAAQGELEADPVDSGIAGGADEHLGLALEGLDDGLDEGGGLAGAGRAVDDGDLLRLDDPLDGILLAGVEPWEREAWKAAEGGLAGAYKGVAQADKTLVGATLGSREGVEHDAVGGGVDAEADAEQTAVGMGTERLKGGTGGDGDGEGADVDLLDIALYGQFAEGGAVVGKVEERDGLAGLEIGVDLIVGDFVREG